MSLKNEYHLRTVANSASKACYICYKPTIRVLITPDNRDFFYVCTGHLTDKGFCSPVIDPEVEAAKKKKEELDREIALVKQEYEGKQRRKKDKAKAKDSDKDKDKSDSAAEADSEKLEKEKNEKIKNLESAENKGTAAEEVRVFTLHRNFYQQRLDRLRNIQTAQKNRERMKDPTLFPAAPKNDL